MNLKTKNIYTLKNRIIGSFSFFQFFNFFFFFIIFKKIVIYNDLNLFLIKNIFNATDYGFILGSFAVVFQLFRLYRII